METDHRPPPCGHDDPAEHPRCEYCWWLQTHDVDDETGEVTELWEGQ